MILPHCCRPITREQMKHHETPVNIFREFIYFEIVAGVEDRLAVLGLVCRHADQKSQGVQVQALILAAL